MALPPPMFGAWQRSGRLVGLCCLLAVCGGGTHGQAEAPALAINSTRRLGLPAVAIRGTRDEEDEDAQIRSLKKEVQTLTATFEHQKEEMDELKKAAREELEKATKLTGKATAIAIIGSMVSVNMLFVVLNMWRPQRRLMWSTMKETVSIFSAVLLYSFLDDLLGLLKLHHYSAWYWLTIFLTLLIFLLLYGYEVAVVYFWPWYSMDLYAHSLVTRWITDAASWMSSWVAALPGRTSGPSDPLLNEQLVNQVNQLNRRTYEPVQKDYLEMLLPYNRMECGLLLAHTCGFAFIEMMGYRLQEGSLAYGLIPCNFDTWDKSVLYLIQNLILYYVVFFLAIIIRWGTVMWLERSDDGEKKRPLIKKFEETIVDAENDVLGLIFAFLGTTILRQFITGKLPGKMGVDKPEVLATITPLQICIIIFSAGVCVLLALLIQCCCADGEEEEASFEQTWRRIAERKPCGLEMNSLVEPVNKICRGLASGIELAFGRTPLYKKLMDPRAGQEIIVEHIIQLPDVVFLVLTMSCAWCWMFGHTWLWSVIGFAEGDMHALKLLVAITVSLEAFVIVAFWGNMQQGAYMCFYLSEDFRALVGNGPLKFLADFLDLILRPAERKPGRRRFVYRSSRTVLEKVLGFLLGFSWEACFDDAGEGLQDYFEGTGFQHIAFVLGPIVALGIIGIWAQVLVPMVMESGYYYGFMPRKRIYQCIKETKHGSQENLKQLMEAQEQFYIIYTTLRLLERD